MFVEQKYSQRYVVCSQKLRCTVCTHKVCACACVYAQSVTHTCCLYNYYNIGVHTNSVFNTVVCHSQHLSISSCIDLCEVPPCFRTWPYREALQKWCRGDTFNRSGSQLWLQLPAVPISDTQEGHAGGCALIIIEISSICNICHPLTVHIHVHVYSLYICY